MQGMDTYSFFQYGLGYFFLVFGYFKCMDLKGFAHHFCQYDLIAKRAPVYGSIYPFIEVGLGFLYLYGIAIQTVAILTIILIVVRGVGIVNATRAKDTIMCGCMGTAALFPINWATICANFATVGAAVYLIAN